MRSSATRPDSPSSRRCGRPRGDPSPSPTCGAGWDGRQRAVQLPHPEADGPVRRRDRRRLRVPEPRAGGHPGGAVGVPEPEPRAGAVRRRGRLHRLRRRPGGPLRGRATPGGLPRLGPASRRPGRSSSRR
ncbi:hypothetical protein BRC99_06585 [Halobacteriales archaeon QS_7_69_60]|nr:MAG: hypothetical protein BRC99_06585 [Halobacteriales archaeon QS_7_69_60]